MATIETGIAMAVQFQRPAAFHELPGGGAVDEQGEAVLLGTTVEALRELRSGMRAVVEAAVASLLADPAVRAALERLPAGLAIGAVGDSLTADHQSWAEMLRGALAEVRPDVELVNVAKSGDTTMDLVRRLTLALAGRRPSRYLVLAGSNDACRTVPYDGKMFISDEETRANLQRLADIVASIGGEVVWLTPPPLAEDVAAAFPVFVDMGIRYRADDVARKAAIVRERPEPVIDLHATLGAEAGDDLLLADGVHLAPAGQVAIARRVILEGLG
jgi:acyl-CoA thioesterase-1